MPVWTRRLSILVMLVCCVIIGMRVYIEFAPEDRPAGAGPAQTSISQLPEFVLNDVWGEPTPISQWSGEPLLINFWATWCAPCRREMPLLQTLHGEQAQTGLQVIGIAIDRQPDVERFITESGISYPILVGEEDAMAVSDLFGNAGIALPFTVLVSSTGDILVIYVGELDAGQLREMAVVSQAAEAGELSIDAAREQLAEL